MPGCETSRGEKVRIPVVDCSVIVWL